MYLRKLTVSVMCFFPPHCKNACTSELVQFYDETSFWGVGYYEVQEVWWLGSTKQIMATEKWEDHRNLNKSGKYKLKISFEDPVMFSS